MNRPEAEKEYLYDQREYPAAKVLAIEIFIPVGDWMVTLLLPPVSSVLHMAITAHNADGERVMEFDIADGFRLGNTWFKQESHTALVAIQPR